MRARISRRGAFWTGVGIAAFLFISYFIKLQVEAGGNYYVQDSLLGVMIFHNPYALSAYILAIALIIAASIDVKR